MGFTCQTIASNKVQHAYCLLDSLPQLLLHPEALVQLKVQAVSYPGLLP